MPKNPGENVTRKLRDRLLNGTAAEFGVEPDGNVWGVLMEMAYPEAVATLVAIADGTASIYISTGGGVIGGGPHPAINAAARRFVHAAGRFVSSMVPASDIEYPNPGRVKFFVLTTTGVVSAEAEEATLGAGKAPLSPLFYEGHQVITGLRQVSEGRQA